MKTSFIFAGIYHLDNLRWLESCGYDSFELDLRPRSFQFLPHYQAHDIIKGALPTSRFQIHFQNENQMLIEKFIADCDSTQVNYTFSGQVSASVLKSLDVDFSLEIDSDNELILDDSEVLSLSRLQKLTINYGYLHYQLMNAKIINLLKKLAPIAVPKGLKLKFSDDLATSMWEMIKFDPIIIDLDARVENGYRQFSRDLFESEFSRLTKLYPELVASSL